MDTYLKILKNCWYQTTTTKPCTEWLYAMTHLKIVYQQILVASNPETTNGNFKQEQALSTPFSA